MKKRGLMLLVGICLVLILLTTPLAVSCATQPPTPPATQPPAPAATQAPAPTATPSPAPAATPTPTPPAASKPVELKAITFVASNTATVHFLGVFADIVNKRSNGELTIKILGGPEVIPAAAQPEAIRTGKVDVLFMTGERFKDVAPEISALHICQYTPAEERKVGTFDWISGVCKNKLNTYLIGKMSGPKIGWFTFTNFPVHTPKDLASRQLGSRAVTYPFVKALGSTPTDVGTDWYTPVERGVIDGAVLPIANIVSYGLQSKLQYMVDHIFYGSCNSLLLMNLDVWNKLPPNLQKIVNDAGIEVEGQVEGYFASEEQKARDVLLKAGMQFVKFSLEDTNVYLNLAYDAAWKDFKNSVSADAYDTARKYMVK